MDQHYEIARDLLSIQAVQIKTEGHFTWTSGIKSPIYCDNRLTMSYPHIRKRITNAFVNKIKKMNLKPDVIAGCATAGIPHAAWIAEQLDLPMIYVRAKPKGHGKGNQVEGKVDADQTVLVIEDLISTGGSSIETANVLRDDGIEVVGVLAIFTYGLKESTRRFESENIPFSTITSFDYLVDALFIDKEITKNEKQDLLDWRNNL